MTDFPGWTDADWFRSAIDDAINAIDGQELGSTDHECDRQKDRDARDELIRRLDRMANRVSPRMKLKEGGK